MYSIYDYLEHVGREGSIFEEHPWYWLSFSLSAVLSFALVVLLVKKAIEQVFHQKSLIIEVGAIGIWLAVYITALGPLIDKVFWPFESLNFKFKFGPFFVVLIGYFIIRLISNVVAGKRALYSK